MTAAVAPIVTSADDRRRDPWELGLKQMSRSLTDNLQLDAATWFADAAGAVATSPAAGAIPAIVERAAAAGQMAPLVRRDEAEAYRVVEGEVTFFVDGEVVEAEPGDVVVAAAGAARTFRVESESARWTVVTRVASLERFLDFGRAVSEALDPPSLEWPSPSEQAVVAAIGAENGIELLGPPGALPGDRS
jgi:mannose-6-phosphate isomerase-like protein (cupin superfamily)